MMSRPRLRLAAVFAAGAIVTGATSVSAAPDAAAIRLAGDNRYETAATVAASAFADGDTTIAIVATGESFADALAANYLAGALHSPILLTPGGTMDPGLPGALDAIGATGVEVIGGDGAISDAVTAEIEDAGYQASRVAGQTRFETAKAIAELLPPEAIGEHLDFGRTAIIVNGLTFADALAAGPMSFSQGWPILLTNADRLQGDAGAAIQDLGIEHAIIVGGTGVVSDGVVGDLTQLGVTNERLSGTDRTLTAKAVADFLVDTLGYGTDDVILARGDAFPDALSAGPRGGDELEPILLTISADFLGAAASTFLKDRNAGITRIEIFGGTGAISQSVEDLALSYARGQQ
jgi:putative cell wall-binding protein